MIKHKKIQWSESSKNEIMKNDESDTLLSSDSNCESSHSTDLEENGDPKDFIEDNIDDTNISNSNGIL